MEKSILRGLYGSKQGLQQCNLHQGAQGVQEQGVGSGTLLEGIDEQNRSKHQQQTDRAEG